MTEPAPEYAPADRTGYQVVVFNETDPDAQTNYSIVRESDGVGLGAYSSQQIVDNIIAKDRQLVEDIAETGLSYVPPLFNVPSENAPMNENGTPAE